MALAIDASSPAVASGAGPTATTASFTPPAGSVLLISAAMDGNLSPSAPSITDSLGAHLTYTQTDWQSGLNAPNAGGQAVMWWAPVATSAAMTVSVTNGDAGAPTIAVKVRVITGADTVTPIGAHGKSASKSAASIAQSYTASATSGWGFIAESDFDQTGAETAGTGCTSDGSANVGTAITYGFMRRTTADDVSGNSNTLNVTLPGTSTNLSWVYAEIKPAATATASIPAPVTPGTPIRPPRGSALILSSQAASADSQPASVASWAPRLKPTPGSALVLAPTAPSVDAQRPPVVVGAPPRAPGVGWSLAAASVSPSSDAQPGGLVAPAGIRPAVLSGAIVVGSTAPPPAPTDSPPTAAVVGGVRLTGPGSALILSSVAPSPDLQPPAVMSTATRGPTPGSALTAGSRADPQVVTDAPTRPLSISPARPPGPGAVLVLSSVSASRDAQPAAAVALAGVLPIRSGSALVLRSTALPPPPTLTPATIGSFTIPRPAPAGSVLLLRMASDFASCTTARPFTGTTGRPAIGLTTRPNTGTTDPPC